MIHLNFEIPSFGEVTLDLDLAGLINSISQKESRPAGKSASEKPPAFVINTTAE